MSVRVLLYENGISLAYPGPDHMALHFLSKAKNIYEPGKTTLQPAGEKACPRHPRSWIEKKVLFITKTRQCPYCELESYTVDPRHPEVPPPCEPGFGGFASPERKPSRTPRAAGPGQRRAPTPRSAGRGGGAPRAGGRGGGRGTPAERSHTPRSTTVARRTAVFTPTQTPRGEPHGRPPRGGPAGTARTRHQRSSSAPTSRGTSTTAATSTSHRRRATADHSSRSHHPADRTPTSSRPRNSKAMMPMSPTVAGEEKEKNDDALMPPLHPSVTSSANRRKSLMFTSAARKRAGSHDAAVTPNSSLAGISPGSTMAPPSPSGSGFSVSTLDSSALGVTSSAASSSRGPMSPRARAAAAAAAAALDPDLKLPADVNKRASPAPSTPLRASAARSAVASPASRAGSGGGIDRSRSGERYPLQTPRDRPVVCGNARPAANALVEATKRTGLVAATKQVGPLAIAALELADAVEALSPEQVSRFTTKEGVLHAAVATSRAVRAAREATSGDAGGGGGGGGGYMDSRDQEETAEAAAAILVEAEHAVDNLAQLAHALARSDKELIKFRESPTYVERHRAADEAVCEAARRAGVLLANLAAAAAAGGKSSRESAAADRKWFAVLDRHEAWMRRRDSRKGLMMAEQEISADAVTVFEDCPLRKDTLGTTFAAEYLGLPVAATVLEDPCPGSMADPAATLHATAVSEIRAIAQVMPASTRLARTHGSHVASNVAPGGSRRESSAVLVLVSELVEGGSLRDHLKDSKIAGALAVEQERELGPDSSGFYNTARGQGEAAGSSAGSSADRESRRRRLLLADVAQGLACLHERGLCHGALTPDSVLLDADGRIKLSLSGLSETRKAVATLREIGNSAATTPSETDCTTGTSSTPAPTAWTPPEAFAEAGQAAGEVDGDTAVAPLSEGLAAGMAADAFAFGMIAWQVLTGVQPWLGLSPDDVADRVRRGERPPLSFEPITLEGCEGFGDLVRLLWAQDPTARPSMHDVWLRLREAQSSSRPPVPTPPPVEYDASGDSFTTTGSGEAALDAASTGAVTVWRRYDERNNRGESFTTAPEGDSDDGLEEVEITSGLSLAATAPGVDDEAGGPEAGGLCGGNATPAGGGGGEAPDGCSAKVHGAAAAAAAGVDSDVPVDGGAKENSRGELEALGVVEQACSDERALMGRGVGGMEATGAAPAAGPAADATMDAAEGFRAPMKGAPAPGAHSSGGEAAMAEASQDLDADVDAETVVTTLSPSDRGNVGEDADSCSSVDETARTLDSSRGIMSYAENMVSRPWITDDNASADDSAASEETEKAVVGANGGIDDKSSMHAADASPRREAGGSAEPVRYPASAVPLLSYSPLGSADTEPSPRDGFGDVAAPATPVVVEARGPGIRMPPLVGSQSRPPGRDLSQGLAESAGVRDVQPQTHLEEQGLSVGLEALTSPLRTPRAMLAQPVPVEDRHLEPSGGGRQTSGSGSAPGATQAERSASSVAPVRPSAASKYGSTFSVISTQGIVLSPLRVVKPAPAMLPVTPTVAPATSGAATGAADEPAVVGAMLPPDFPTPGRVRLSTPQRARRAGKALQGFASSLTRLGKKNRDAGVGGVVSFPIEERITG